MGVSALASPSSTQDDEYLRSRIRDLEDRLSKVDAESVLSHGSNLTPYVETTTSRIGGSFHVHRESRLSGQPQSVTRGITHKTRHFGRSHWINVIGLLQDIPKTIEPYVREEKSRLFSGLQRCKALARVIKAKRTPPWPAILTTDVPSKDIADKLIECYWRTIETVYQILHQPSFERDYNAFWLPASRSDMPFLVQMKLILAIGAAMYDEEFSLRVSAIQWVCEAQTWLSDPNFKSRFGIQSIQTEILLLIAREVADVGADSIWTSVGSLLRRSMHIGLHKDPGYLPGSTNLAVEMRRRLWNVVLELSLQSSLTSGGPPLISIDDFDTKLPGNFDDDQLMAEHSMPKPEESFTRVTIARALRETFQVRLEIAKFLNDLSSTATYEETIRLDAELRASCKVLYRRIRGCKSSTGASPSDFALRAVDFTINRCLLAIHVPFFGPALQETTYAYSRNVVVEISLKLWHAAYSTLSHMDAQPRNDTILSDHDNSPRLNLGESSFFRNTAFQAAVLIAVELRTQLQEEESLGPPFLRADLLSVLGDAKAWCRRCIETGETSSKGYLLMCVLNAQINGMRRGLSKDEIAEHLVEAAEDAMERCSSILGEIVARGQADSNANELQQMAETVTNENMEGWDFVMFDSTFDASDADPMGWLFN